MFNMFLDLPLPFIALTSLIIIWLAAITLFLAKTISHYNNLSKGASKQNLSSLLEKMLSEIEFSKKDLIEITKRCDKIEQDGLFHAQKIGLLRFNPFSDTGGDQSFILAILNGRDDGVLISSLHGRVGTRWYAKTIKEGKGMEHELSDEEKTVIKNAKKIK